MMDQDYIEYKEFVRKQVSKEDGTPCLSDVPEHIPAVIEVLFETAKEKIQIVTDRFDSAIYGHSAVVEAAIAFLKRSPETQIEIISNHPFEPRHPFTTTMRKHGLINRLELSQCEKLWYNTLELVLADSMHYRFQSKQTNGSAFFCFNDAETGRIIGLHFENRQLESRPMPMPMDSIGPQKDRFPDLDKR